MTSTADDQAREWDDRYRASTSLWSGAVNAALAAEVETMPRGRALDVCSGEGADAIWLALYGWRVTAVEISEVAVARAAAAAADAGVDVSWVTADFVAQPPIGEFDLVVSMYPALLHAAGDAVTPMMDAVAPGGTLLVVHHDMSHHHDHPDDAGFDPDDYLQPVDVHARLGDGWRVEVYETRPRVSPPGHDGPDVPDIVLRAVRTS